MAILLTGSSGTIGTRLFEALLKRDYEVVGVDVKQNRWDTQLNGHTIIADLRKPEELFMYTCKLSEDTELIIHFAANARVYELVEHPLLALENIVTTFNILDFARKNDIKRIIFSSSRETYGNLGYPKINENRVRIENCENPYSASKIAGEALIHSWNKVYGIDFAIVRFSNIYGMYDDSDRVVPFWIRQTLNNQDLIVYGRDKVLDFTYIDDSINGIIKIIEKFDEVKNNTFNIAYGEGIKLTYVAEKIRKLLNGKNNIIIKGNRLGEVQKFEADIVKASKSLGYKPKIDINTGLKKTIEWYKQFFKMFNANDQTRV